MNDIVLCAEIGINHNGDIDIAKRMIDVAAKAGCHYVKFQKRNIDLVYSKDELDAPRPSPWGKTNRDQKRGLEFGLDEYRQIDIHCQKNGIGWFASCWDVSSVDFIEKHFSHVPYHKVASAMGTNRAFLEKLKSTGKPIILSTGMMTEAQISDAAATLGQSLKYVLHCTSTYPTKPSEMNISYIEKLKQLLPDVSIGFSNHYSGLLWVPIAVTYGATFLEFHVTLDRTMYGTDQAASIEPDGVDKIAEHVRICQEMLGTGQKIVYDSELPIMKKLRKVTDF